jgi:hypothetical protein
MTTRGNQSLESSRNSSKKASLINRDAFFHLRSEREHPLGFTRFKLRPKRLFSSVVAFEFQDWQIRF